MVVDTSALISILRMEPERERLLRALVADPTRLVSAVTTLEAAMVLEGRYGPQAVGDLELLLFTFQARVVAFTGEHADAARRAWKKFGKERHSAALNLGDCCVYATASLSGEPVLAQGTDFAAAGLPIVNW